MPETARVAGACLRDHGGEGPPAVLVPSLINPPRILDLDAQVSLAAAVARMGRRSLLLDMRNVRATFNGTTFAAIGARTLRATRGARDIRGPVKAMIRV